MNAAASGACTERPLFENGADNGVATVPGCNATQTDSGRVRPSSIAAVRTTWLSAAFDAPLAVEQSGGYYHARWRMGPADASVQAPEARVEGRSLL